MPTTFVCTATDPFDLFHLAEAIAAPQQSSARLSDSTPIEVHVTHPDREADGSCRWCGCKDDDVVLVPTR